MTSYFHYSNPSMKKNDDNLRRKINILKMDFKIKEEDVFYHRAGADGMWQVIIPSKYVINSDELQDDGNDKLIIISDHEFESHWKILEKRLLDK